jgi:NAD(P)-dependent dehydrogenase (short-subunit alcohol dehydrogenase family)
MKMGTENLSFDFSGKNVLITGATKGLGRDLSLAFARAGADLAVTGRNSKALSSLQRDVEDMGRRCVSRVCDLADREQCIEMASRFCSEFKTIDILINNAGISFPETLATLEPDHWDATLNVNLRAPALISKTVAAMMAKQGGGVIINVSSNASLAGIDEHAAYCASKFGLEGLTKVMAAELGPKNIRVNSVAPAVILTPMGLEVWGDEEKAAPLKAKTPLGRFLEPEEVVRPILFLASDGAAMIHGERLVIDGGMHARLF